jgi:hypothetical protein
MTVDSACACLRDIDDKHGRAGGPVSSTSRQQGYSVTALGADTVSNHCDVQCQAANILKHIS